MTESSKASEEQLWQAFQFVSGELSVDETKRFEERLESDPFLCDAVVEATLLTSSVLHCQPEESATQVIHSHSRGRAHNFSRSIAAVVALACCLILAVVLSNMPEAETETVQADVIDAEVLVTTWADSFAADIEDIPEIDEQTDQDLDVPDWMLAGLTLNAKVEVNSSDMPPEILQPGDMEL